MPGREAVEPKGKEVRYTIAVDFDAVIHSYESRWVNAHTIPDFPVPGAIAWLADMAQHFDIVINSTRCKTWRGRRAMRAWLVEHFRDYLWPKATGHSWEAADKDNIRAAKKLVGGFRFDKKPIALIYIDDRGYRFTGANFPTAEQIHRARPWNKETRAL